MFSIDARVKGLRPLNEKLHTHITVGRRVVVETCCHESQSDLRELQFRKVLHVLMLVWRRVVLEIRVAVDHSEVQCAVRI